MERCAGEQSRHRRNASAVSRDNSPPASGGPRGRRVLFVGHSYYHPWYLSRELRKLGWRADVLNWDPNSDNDLYYHGEDFKLTQSDDADADLRRHLRFYLASIRRYDVFHFSNFHGLRFGDVLHNWAASRWSPGAEIRFLKRFGKKIVYSNTGCLDGVKQSTFAAWGDRPVCADCPWRDDPVVCSDEGNSAWGEYRNRHADYQVLFGGNHADWNLDPSVHEAPEFYCLDPEFWRFDLEIPPEHRVDLPERTVKIYHAVGNLESRSELGSNRNLKSTHIYLPLIEKLKAEGLPVELLFATGIPNAEVRYQQAQADIVVDMLTYGFFGANAREALMLGKPVVCYLRPEWLEQMRCEVPGYVDELPVVSATPDTVEQVLRDLIADPARRREIGRRSREFAVKWHSAEAGAAHFDKVYGGLVEGRPASETFR